MAVYNNILAGAAGSGGAADFQIDRSLRFTKGDSAHLYRQITTKGNTRTFTFACWFKKTRTGLIDHNFFSGSTGTNTGAYFCFPDNGANALGSADCLSFKSDPGAGGGSVETDAVFRDLSAWYHVVLAVDTTQATASNRVKIWVNGVSQSLSISSSPGYPNLNSELSINDVGHAAVAAEANGSSTSVRFHGDFYLADIHFIDGQALTASDFGDYDDDNIWQPKEVSVSSINDGTNWASSSYNSVDIGSSDMTNAFDGDLSTATSIGLSAGGATVTFTPPSSITVTKSVRVYMQVDRGQSISVNGTETNSSVSAGWNDTGFTGTLTSLAIGPANSGSSSNISAIEINGEILISNYNNSTGYGTNGFHLDFSDNSSDSALGTDSSGNNNTWTVNNLTGSLLNPDVSIANATGALPIRNTTGTYGGTVATGNRTDSQSGLQLAMPLRNGVNDESGNSYTISNTGVSFTTDHSKFYGQSAAFFDSDKINISNASGLGAFGTGDFTVEAYVKFTDNGHNYGRVIEFGSTNNNGFVIDGTTAPFRLRYDGNNNSVYGTAGTIPLGKWTHVAAVRSSGTLKFYVDGVEGGSHTFTYNLSGGSAQLGNYLGSQLDFDGYMQDLRVYSSAKYTSNFTPPNDPANGLPGEGLDSLIDTPTNYTSTSGNNGGNYCTWNPFENNGTLSNGNLDIVTPTSGTAKTLGTIAFPSSGKYYFEVTPTNNGDTGYVYIGDNTTQAANAVAYYADGRKRIDGTFSSYGASWDDNDVIGCAVNVDDGEVTFYKNGSSQGTISYTISGKTLFPAVSDGTSNSGTTFSANFGQRPFSISSVPTGFVSLCTTNLPDPTIDSSDYFDIALYSGNGTTGQSITGLGFSPDLVWIKERSSTGSPFIVDTVRGANKPLITSSTNTEYSKTEFFESFDSNGFTVDYNGVDTSLVSNRSGQTYAAWAWDAGANSSKTYTVKVVSDSGNKYRFDDFGTSAVTLDLEEGSTYVFDQSDSSNSGHPLRFSTTSDGTHNSGSEYTTGVTTTGTPGSAGAKTTIVVASGAPTLYYYCSSHSGMGGQANTNSTAGASNFDGSIQSTVRANASAGFSVVKYSYSSTATVGHGLGAVPSLIIHRNIGSSMNWYVYHESLGASNAALLDSNAASGSTSTMNSTAPTSSVYTINNWPSGNTIAYCFSPVSQYSSFGSYEGNNSSDGPFVFTGMRPRWIMIKNADSTGAWAIYDTARDDVNAATKRLFPNLSSAESDATSNSLDILSNGFKIRATGNVFNDSGTTYIYAAFAENFPFKTARAR